MKEVLNKLLKDSSERTNMGNKAKGLLQKNRGAVARYLDLIAKVLEGI
ncbi:MAG: hypothetical protein JRJ43_11785 [Deltaproteobacteria bacterium]|nr:hypothetical protein [Deltaproteobacteria bacterium]